MDLLHAIRTNGSVRAFKPEPVDDATIVRILDSARFAPSGSNKQGWHVISVRNRNLRTQLAALAQMTWNEYVAQSEAGVRPFAPDASGRWPGPPPGMDLAAESTTTRPSPFLDALADAPAVLVICVDITVLAAMDCELDRLGLVPGASIYPFTQNILLAAREEGLGGVLTTFLTRREPEAKALLGLPAEYAIAAMIALGVPEHQNTKLTRKPVTEFATTDRFDGPRLDPAFR